MVVWDSMATKRSRAVEQRVGGCGARWVVRRLTQPLPPQTRLLLHKVEDICWRVRNQVPCAGCWGRRTSRLPQQLLQNWYGRQVAVLTFVLWTDICE